MQELTEPLYRDIKVEAELVPGDSSTQVMQDVDMEPIEVDEIPGTGYSANDYGTSSSPKSSQPEPAVIKPIHEWDSSFAGGAF